MSSILSFLVIDNYEQDFLNRLITQNYFYFDSIERKKILDICFDVITDDFTITFDKKFKLLYNSFLEFISHNKVLVLNGFTNFRIKAYMDILDEIVSEAVNTFIIEKEYLEFISLLKLYINSSPAQCNIVHVIYSSSESTLLDENKNIIVMPKSNLDARILSDISFSSNDYTLNSLLTLIPKKIYIHLIDNYIDEFINTLQLVFENRINLCTDCDICRIYQKQKGKTENF